MRSIGRFILLTGIVSVSAFTARAQNFDDRIAAYITRVENPYPFLQKYESLGVKHLGTPALDSTKNWLKKLMEAEGYTTRIQAFTYGTDSIYNLEYYKQGAVDSCIVIGAHYDSWVGPGVNDNGSGDFALYQIAKWLKPLNTKYAVRFLYFTGEEVAYLGSRHYVERLDKGQIKIRFMLNMDQLGGTLGQDNGAIKCERDEMSANKLKSSAIAETISKCYSLYTGLIPVITPAYNSDYLAFRDSGYIIAGIYQHSSFPFYHTPDDVLKNMDVQSLRSVVSGALSSVLYLSGAEVPVNNIPERNNKQDIHVYYTENTLMVENGKDALVSVYDCYGSVLHGECMVSDQQQIDMKGYPAGLYIIRIKQGERYAAKKVFRY